MSNEKYIGLDVHQATISVAVVDSQGKLVMESILETKASTILEFLAGLRGALFVTFEEGTWAAWLYELLKPHVAHLIVCNPRFDSAVIDRMGHRDLTSSSRPKLREGGCFVLPKGTIGRGCSKIYFSAAAFSLFIL